MERENWPSTKDVISADKKLQEICGIYAEKYVQFEPEKTVPQINPWLTNRKVTDISSYILKHFGHSIPKFEHFFQEHEYNEAVRRGEARFAEAALDGKSPISLTEFVNEALAERGLPKVDRPMRGSGLI